MNDSERTKLCEDIINYTESAFKHWDMDIEDADTNVRIGGGAYVKYCISALADCRMNPTIAAIIARMYMLFQTKMKASILILNRSYKYKEIRDFAYSFRAEFPKFVDDIEYLCRNYKSNKCILIYNYTYVLSTYKELNDVNILHCELAKKGITLVDAIRVTKGKPIHLISPLDDSGYNMKKK